MNWGVPHLRNALRDYASDKVRERATAGDLIREIFSNRGNIDTFDSGAANAKYGEHWSALFAAIYEPVKKGKAEALRRKATPQAEKRVADAISLVRFMAERCNHRLPRRTVWTIVDHMTMTLVAGRRIFEPAVRDYAKSLRSLLSYPPHLESLGAGRWKRLMSVCWAGVLGDEISLDEQWGDEGYDELGDDDNDGMEVDRKPTISTQYAPKAILTQSQLELLAIIPLLLSKHGAPILPVFPSRDSPADPPTSIAYSILVKAHRFLDTHTSETSGHLHVLQACNSALAELELNSRSEFVNAGVMLLPDLQALWQARSKPLREQVIIAIRMLLPFITHSSVAEAVKKTVGESLGRIAEALPKEAGLRWGLQPLDLQCVRLARLTRPEDGSGRHGAFHLAGVQPGFDFSHDQAFSWMIIELYAECYAQILTDNAHVPAPTADRASKKRRKADSITELLRHTSSGPSATRLVSLQAILFLVGRRGNQLSLKHRAEIVESLIESLDGDDEALQSWAFIALAVCASSLSLGDSVDRTWASAMRKTTSSNASRAACFCALTLMETKAVPLDRIATDIGAFLRQIDLQGPPFPYDSVAAFVSASLALAKSDVSLYSQRLDEKVQAWLSRYRILDGPRGKSRMEPMEVQDTLALVAHISGLDPPPMQITALQEYLPECPLVDRALAEEQTAGLRDFILDGTMPAAPPIVSRAPAEPAPQLSMSMTPLMPSTGTVGSTDESAVPTSRHRQVSSWLLLQVTLEVGEWTNTSSLARSPERLRKTIDLAMLATSYQAILRRSNFRGEAALSSGIRDLLKAILPELASGDLPLAAQHFVWTGLASLCPDFGAQRTPWRILLLPNDSSGMRPDVSPNYAPDEDGTNPTVKKWLEDLWTLPDLSESLKAIADVARHLLDDTTPQAESSGMPLGTQAVTSIDDDDFGEIRVAETDNMPLSKEACEGQRTTQALKSIQLRIRLFSASALGARGPVKDVALIETLINLDSQGFVQLAELVTLAVGSHLLRLSSSALEAIFNHAEELGSSEAHGLNERLIVLIFHLCRCSTFMWAPPEVQHTAIAERIMGIAHWAIRKQENIASWRVSVGMLQFIDEYLDYENGSQLWEDMQDQATDEHGNDKYSIPALVAHALIDSDIRVRIRGATSTAGLWMLTKFESSRHQDFYLATMEQQPRLPTYWNAFLTDLLWKLNCIVASATPRPAVLYHLLEVPLNGDQHDLHLQKGLEAVAARLGYDGLAGMFMVYAPIVVPLMLKQGQSPLALSPKMCGFVDPADRARQLLDVLSPLLLVAGHLTFFNQLCEDVGLAASTYSVHFVYPVTARLLCRCIAEGTGDAKKISDDLVDGLLSMPFAGKIDAQEVVKSHAPAVLVELLRLVTSEHSTRLLTQELGRLAGGDAQIFADMIEHLPQADSLQPDFVGIDAKETALIDAIAYVQASCPKLDRAAVCYNALLQIFADLDATSMAGERWRALKCLTLTIACFPDTFTDSRITMLLMREVIAMLDQVDVSEMAMYLFGWTAERISKCTLALVGFDHNLVRLGRIQPRLSTEMQGRLDACIEKEAKVWKENDDLWVEVELATTLWPEGLRKQLGAREDMTYGQIADFGQSATSADVLKVCERLDETWPSRKDSVVESFAQSMFWTIKNSLGAEYWDYDGAKAFLSLLARVDGQVRVVCASDRSDVESPARYEKLLLRDRTPRSAPLVAIRVLAVNRVLRLASKDDRSARFTARRALRQLSAYLLPMVAGSVKARQIAESVAPYFDLLLSPFPPELELPARHTITTVLKENVPRLASDPRAWMHMVASRLCELASADEAFWSRLAVVFRPDMEISMLSSFIPILAQALLTGAKDAKAVKERQALLTPLLNDSVRHPDAHPAVVSTVLDTVVWLQQFPPTYNRSALGPLYWLDIDYLLLAEAAAKAGSFATALMFLEISRTDPQPAAPGVDSKAAVHVDRHAMREQNVLLQVYSNVDDPDGFYGIKIMNVRDSLRRRLDHEEEYMRAFGLHGADLEMHHAGATAAGDIVASARNLHFFGLHRMAQTVAREVKSAHGSKASDELFFDIAWRTGDWDLPVSESAKATSAGSFYAAMRAVHRERDQVAAHAAVEGAIRAEMTRLGGMGIERMSEIHRSIDNLLCLGEVAAWYDTPVQRALAENDFEARELRRFSDLRPTLRFPLAEKQHAARISVISAARQRENGNLLGDLSTPLSEGLVKLEVDSRLSFCAYARDEDNEQAALNAITAVQHLEGRSETPRAKDEFGEVLWMHGEHALALQHLTELVDVAMSRVRATNKEDKAVAARAGVLLGRKAHWSKLSRQSTASELTEMFSDAWKTLESVRSPVYEDELAQICHDFACFAAEEQQHMRSNGEMDKLRGYRDRKQAAVTELDTAVLPAGAKAQQSKSFKETRSDRAQSLDREQRNLDKYEADVDNLTRHALRMFATALRLSDRFDDSITRMCSIWLAHLDPKSAPTATEAKRADMISKSFASHIEQVPSHKFIFLGPQLVARLYRPRNTTHFNTQLNGLMLRISRDHPYHLLYHIIALVSENPPPGPKKGRKSDAGPGESDGRTLAASEIMQVLNVDHVHTLARTASQHMKVFSDAAMPWCLTAPPKDASTRGVLNVPATCELMRLPRGLDIPIPTVIPPIRPNRDYSDVPKLKRFRSKYTILGGIHRPKKMLSLDMLDVEHQHLFKGDDEIRQDAVMEQVFSMTNDILKRDRQTKARQLRFRTYVVIPLARKTGLLEFVAEGISIGDWLKPAHDRYRLPGEISTSTFRDSIKGLQEENFENPQIVKVWESNKPRFPPVMRHYFREKQPEPMGWFTMRLNYARSVAVTSMVGHMLGIGDRHLSNIMIDQVNGEVIHIDFGIVFEEGANLRIPERVPFRLTDDVVDGLGTMGVDGTFRRCSEQTLRVLRASSPLIMTVLEVFKHDPLFAWKGDPDKLLRVQGQGQVGAGKALQDQVNATAMEKADRVLEKIRHKLRDELGVEYTVNDLINSARRTEHLAKIYHGWHSWF